MPSELSQVALTGGNYTARSLTAGAQRCLNLFPEKNEKDAPFPFTYYPRAGLRFVTSLPAPPVTYGCRGAYTASNGQLYEVVDNKVYATSAIGMRTLLGTINSGVNTVYMKDNGVVMVLVDGTPSGWVVNLGTNGFTVIADAAFYGADRVAYLDTFLIFNRPDTTQIYLSPPDWNGVDPFDALDVADKVGAPDVLVSLVVNAAQAWLIGQDSTEVWYNAGGVDFPLARVPGILIQHGTPAPQSVAQADVSVFWLAQNEQGERFFVQGIGYDVKRISTHAIEAEWQTYSTVVDAVAFTYQLSGHTFVHLTFPTADRTWVFDMATGFWHEECWIDSDGLEHRHRANTVAHAYGKIFCGDWATGNLLQMDLAFYQDIAGPIAYRRGFPHLRKGGNRVGYDDFRLDGTPGQAVGLTTDEAPQIFMRYSDDNGYSWCDPIASTLGSTGEYGAQAFWQQLGMGRDRVFEVFWSYPYLNAISGAYVRAEATDA